MCVVLGTASLRLLLLLSVDVAEGQVRERKKVRRRTRERFRRVDGVAEVVARRK